MTKLVTIDLQTASGGGMVSLVSPNAGGTSSGQGFCQVIQTDGTFKFCNSICSKGANCAHHEVEEKEGHFICKGILP